MPPTIQPRHIRALEVMAEGKNSADETTALQQSWVANRSAPIVTTGQLRKQTGTGGGYTTGTGWEILEGGSTGTVKEASEALTTSSSATVTLEGAAGTWPVSPATITIGTLKLTCTGVTGNGTATAKLTGCKLVSGSLTAAEAKGLAVSVGGGNVAIRAGYVVWMNPHTGLAAPYAFVTFDANGNVRQTISLAGIGKWKANGEPGEEAGYTYW